MESPSKRSLRPMLVLPLAVLASVAIPVLLAAMPREGRPVAVIAWSTEWGGAAAVAARAEGVLHSASPGNRIVIASADGPDFVARLYAAGAALVLDAALASACLSPLLALTPTGNS